MEDAMNCFMLVVGVGGYLGLGTLNFIGSHRKCFKDGSGKTEFCLGFMWYALAGLNLWSTVGTMITQGANT